MRKFPIILVAISALIVSDCKRNFRAGNVEARLSNNNHHWSLVTYRVNGKDSTNLINFSNLEDFKKNFFIAGESSRTAGISKCFNRLYELKISFEDENRIFKVSSSTRSWDYMLFTKDPCLSASVSSCQRNVFFPEGKATNWTIMKFTQKHLELSCNQTNHYFIELETR